MIKTDNVPDADLTEATRGNVALREYLESKCIERVLSCIALIEKAVHQPEAMM